MGWFFLTCIVSSYHVTALLLLGIIILLQVVIFRNSEKEIPTVALYEHGQDEKYWESFS